MNQPCPIKKCKWCFCSEAATRGVLCEKVFLEISQNAQKHLCQSLFFNKGAGLSPATLLKKRLWQRCFLVNFVNFQRIHFLQNTSGRLLLEVNNEDHPREANKSKEALLDINALNL